MNELLKYKNEYDRLNEKCNLSGEEALEEVIKDGYVLRYVTEQTPELCLAAVKQDGDALQYVNSKIFEELEKPCRSSWWLK